MRDEEVEMMTILRINRPFMEYMREMYNTASRQKFTRTLIDEKAAAELDKEMEGSA